MGVFNVTLTVSDKASERSEEIEAMVDTGASNTTLPAELLERLGIPPYRSSIVELADGRQLELPLGRTWVRVDGQQEFTQFMFGPPGSGALLGAITLEEMNLAVDPIGKRLVPVNRYLK